MFHGSSGTFIGIESVILLETNRSKCFKHIQKNTSGSMVENLPSKFEMCPSQRKKSENLAYENLQVTQMFPLPNST